MIPPVFENFQHGFRIVVYPKTETVGETVTKPVRETVGEILKGSSALILNYIKDNPAVTREELAELTKLSVRGVEYQLKKLREAHFIERIGSTKSGSWKLR
ncbi:winged helix-turn-helix transcriptional regulator [Emticicia sp. TH156]|uniref:winged helix-turn-helix domain-containing protein n=1 Tax=Emticicia sp. TH156 TaxID=2067454 RepID=UPI0013047B3F|nr:winged helix-turn-helix transcriptional regulator [Emticicia sp. TH156]